MFYRKTVPGAACTAVIDDNSGREGLTTSAKHRTQPHSCHPHPTLSPCILLVQYLDVGCSQPHRNQYIKCSQNQIWRCTLIIPGHGRLRQEDCLKVKARLGCRA